MSFAYRVSGYNRKRKWALFERLVRPEPSLTVLDVGFNDVEHSATDNYIEKHYPWRAQMTALGIDAPVHFGERYPEIKALQYDGVTFPFDNDAFDVCWSNAVLEHVGGHANRWDAQVHFLREIDRVSRTAFITTPNKWFPVEVHTRTPLLHWLPKRWFDAYLRGRKQDWAAGDYMDLLSRGALVRLLADAGIRDYRIVQNRLAGLTLDFAIAWGERIERA
jgi:hypothetical protein